MNRRQLLAMLPLMPAAVALPALSAEPAVAAPMDTRPSFRLSDFVVWATTEPHFCQTHQLDHGVYTHGCVPVAFPLSHLSGAAQTQPATSDAIPMDVMRDCPHSHYPGTPHQHHDYRWEDA